MHIEGETWQLVLSNSVQLPGSLPGPACRDGPLDAPFSSGPRPVSPPADAPPAAGGCPRQSSAGAPHLKSQGRTGCHRFVFTATATVIVEKSVIKWQSGNRDFIYPHASYICLREYVTYWAWTLGCRPTCTHWCSGALRGHHRVHHSCVLWLPPWCIVTPRHRQTCTTADRERMIDKREQGGCERRKGGGGGGGGQEWERGEGRGYVGKSRARRKVFTRGGGCEEKRKPEWVKTTVYMRSSWYAFNPAWHKKTFHSLSPHYPLIIRLFNEIDLHTDAQPVDLVYRRHRNALINVWVRSIAGEWEWLRVCECFFATPSDLQF